MKENYMNTEYNSELEDDLRPEYDETVLHDGIRGKYIHRLQAGTNIVILDSDVAQVFSTNEAVNNALRLLIQVAKTSVTRPGHATS